MAFLRANRRAVANIQFSQKFVSQKVGCLFVEVDRSRAGLKKVYFMQCGGQLTAKLCYLQQNPLLTHSKCHANS